MVKGGQQGCDIFCQNSWVLGKMWISNLSNLVYELNLISYSYEIRIAKVEQYCVQYFGFKNHIHETQLCRQIDRSFNSTRDLIRNWLICTQSFPCSISLQCMLGVGVQSLTPNEPIHIVLCSNLHINSNHGPKTHQTQKALYAKQPTSLQTL